jgi:hypothetical protein
VKTDKEFAIDLVGWLEQYMLRVSILEHILKNSNVKDWQEKATRMATNQGAQALVHEQFEVWRDAILASPDVTTVAREILESLSQQNPPWG